MGLVDTLLVVLYLVYCCVGQTIQNPPDCSSHSIKRNNITFVTEIGTEFSVNWQRGHNYTDTYTISFQQPSLQFDLEIVLDKKLKTVSISWNGTKHEEAVFHYPLRVVVQESKILTNLGVNYTANFIPIEERFDLEIDFGNVYFNCRQKCVERKTSPSEIFPGEENKVIYVRSRLPNYDKEYWICINDFSTHLLPSYYSWRCPSNFQRIKIFKIGTNWNKLQYKVSKENDSTIARIIVDETSLILPTVSSFVYFEFPAKGEISWIEECVPDSVNFTAEPKVLLSVADQIEIFNFNGTAEFDPIQNIKETKVIALDFSAETGCFFWLQQNTNPNGPSIYKNCNNRQYMLVKDIAKTDRFAVDWLTNNIYFTSEPAINGTIEVINQFGQFRQVIVTHAYMERTRGIALNPYQGYMYWTDWGSKPHIGKAGMDGSNVAIIIDSDIKWPNAIVISFETKEIFWNDAGLDYIDKADLNGHNRARVKEIPGRHPFGMAKYNEWIFWTDWHNSQLMKEDLNTNKTISYDYGMGIMDVIIIHPKLQPRVFENPCDNGGGCERLCLLAPGRKRVCK